MGTVQDALDPKPLYFHRSQAVVWQRDKVEKRLAVAEKSRLIVAFGNWSVWRRCGSSLTNLAMLVVVDRTNLVNGLELVGRMTEAVLVSYKQGNRS